MRTGFQAPVPHTYKRKKKRKEGREGGRKVQGRGTEKEKNKRGKGGRERKKRGKEGRKGGSEGERKGKESHYLQLSLPRRLWFHCWVRC
jgi:hypothetical protein